MAKRRQPPLHNYLSEPPEVMSIDESETLLDSSLTSSLSVYPSSSTGQADYHSGLHRPSSYARESSLGSINTQSTTLTGNSKLVSPAVTVVDIDLKARTVDEFDDLQRMTTSQHRRLRRRKSYDGMNEELAGKAKSSSMLLAIDSNQNLTRDGSELQTSGKLGIKVIVSGKHYSLITFCF